MPWFRNILLGGQDRFGVPQLARVAVKVLENHLGAREGDPTVVARVERVVENVVYLDNTVDG